MKIGYREILIISTTLILAGCPSSDDDSDPMDAIVGQDSTGSGSNNTDIDEVDPGSSDTNNQGPDDSSTGASSTDTLTIAIINNGHMLNMQMVAQAYTDDTGIALNWVALEEDVLRNQVTSSDQPSDQGSDVIYDVINIGMQEAPIWGEAEWIEPLSFNDAYDVNDIFPAVRTGLSHDGTLYAAPFYGESSYLMYREDLANAAAVQINDNDSWENVRAAAAAMHSPEEGVYGACLRGKPGWGDNMAFLTTMVNSFGGAWFDSDFRPQLDSPEWNEAVNLYVDIVRNYGPPNSEQNSFNEILALFNEGKCGMWIDATIAPSFITVDNVALAQSPNAGNPVGANWLWAWGMAIPAGGQNSAEALKFIEWATSKEYIQAVGNHPDFGWSRTLTGTRESSYAIPEFQEAFPFASAEFVAMQSAAPEATDLKPYLGVQFASIPEFPDVGSIAAEEIAAAVAGTKSVEDALAAAQAAADRIMQDAGYY